MIGGSIGIGKRKPTTTTIQSPKEYKVLSYFAHFSLHLRPSLLYKMFRERSRIFEIQV